MSMDDSIIIIGTGTFGTSTAYHLAARGHRNITLIDKHPLPSPDSAAFDLNKIIRTEYDEPLYSSLALEAIRAWREPLWDGIFHETGWIVTTLGDPAAVEHLKKSYQNLVDQGQEGNIEFVEGKEEIVKYVPQLEQARGLDEWKGLWNKQAGWAHARDALTKMGTEAEKLGVKFISGDGGTMTGLQVSDDGGKVTGIKVASGEVLTAKRYILCTGAASPALLPELSSQLWSKCWTLAHIELTKEEAEEFKGMPVVDNFELGFMFEPDYKKRWIKICNNFPGYQYRTGEYIDEHGKVTRYSVPRYASDHPEDKIPEEAERGIRDFIDKVLPQFSGRKLHGARICWCTDSPDSHWLIDTHPKFPGGELLLATGDSGHAFKMLPIIGKYIADAFEGKFKDEWRYGSRKDTGNPTRPGNEVKDLRDVGIGDGAADSQEEIKKSCALQ